MTISVALCTYNGSAFLGEQLQSIFDQGRKVDEIIICDDISNDGTIKIIKEFDFKYPGIIKLHINQKNLGSKYNFEKAISLTTGDYILLSDQDDIWIPSKVETIINHFERNKDIQLVFSNGDLIDEYGKDLNSTLWDKWDFNSTLREQWRNNGNAYNDLFTNKNKVTGATVALKEELKKDILPFKLPEGYWHDAWMALHAAKNNGLYFIEESLIKYRIHPGQLVGVGNGKIFNTSDSNTGFYIKQKRRILNLINKFDSFLK